MTIEAIVTTLDSALEQIEAKPESAESQRHRDAILHCVDQASAEGYRLGLVTTLPASRLSAMFQGLIGAQTLERFSVVVTDASQRIAGASRHPFDVALDALGVPRECAAAMASSESEHRQARDYGMSHCVRITDTPINFAPRAESRSNPWGLAN